MAVSAVASCVPATAVPQPPRSNRAQPYLISIADIESRLGSFPEPDLRQVRRRSVIRSVPFLLVFMLVNCLLLYLFQERNLAVLKILLSIFFFAVFVFTLFTLMEFCRLVFIDGNRSSSLYFGSAPSTPNRSNSVDGSNAGTSMERHLADIPPPYESPPSYEELSASTLCKVCPSPVIEEARSSATNNQ